MSNYTLVIDANRKPLTPCKPGVARSLLKSGKAAVFRRYPFTIILKKAVDEKPDFVMLKIDPGSKTTGIVLVTQQNEVIWAMELTHRGVQIKAALEKRRAVRRNRRNRKTRYRKPRFKNRKRPEGWLPPSLMHRVFGALTWVDRLTRLAPVGFVAQELVKFDTQKMENPELSGVEYQQGELFGYEVREDLLEKWGRKCAYCSVSDVPLEVEHIHPRSRGGSNRVSNLTLACRQCNQIKGNQDIQDFLEGKQDLLSKILKVAKEPLKDAAAVNATRWALFRTLKLTGLPVITGTGAQTKFNRCLLNLPKEHWIDAACVGQIDNLELVTTQPLLIKSTGHGCRQVIQIDKYGFPRNGYKVKRPVKDWKTGDIVNVVAGKNAGLKGVRLKTVRTKGNFDIRVNPDKIVSVSYHHIQAVHRQDGYGYSFG